jgi:hypothetical protein
MQGEIKRKWQFVVSLQYFRKIFEKIYDSDCYAT